MSHAPGHDHHGESHGAPASSLRAVPGANEQLLADEHSKRQRRSQRVVETSDSDFTSCELPSFIAERSRAAYLAGRSAGRQAAAAGPLPREVALTIATLFVAMDAQH